ncbi:MAG: PEP-CTERM sorting domain-containing protein [Phycisphaerae bacterium]|nr:PEP-CTERM sorting domain-containing protein [Gemmatimonadaceae bacterium]
MKPTSLYALACTALLALPVVSSAQEVLHWGGVKTAGGDRVGTASTGTYLASRAPYLSTFDIYCIDYDRTAKVVWTSHSVTFADAVGANLLQAQRQLGTEKVWGIQQLRAAAHLTTQFGLSPVGPGGADDQWDTIHGAIWSMFSANTNVNKTAMLNLASSAVAAQGNNAAWDDYVLMLDEQTFGANYSNSMVLNQTFITYEPGRTVTTVTPEPSTYVLLGAGLLAVGFVRRRRMRA